ncbi:MAG: hypothetical protein JXA68_02695 [Ignavibacteriales bacterium]|nr:hypothetical protein [Ignavibacteriales bacterium]
MNEKEKFILLLKTANENRNLEITLFWKRFIFFSITVFILLALYNFSYELSLSPSIFVILLSTIISFIWTLLNRGSKFIIESWETKLKRYERPFILFRKIEPIKRSGVWGGARFSINKLLIALSDFIFIFNLLIFLFDLYKNYLTNYFPSLPDFSSSDNMMILISAILLFSLVYMIVISLNSKIDNYAFEVLNGYTFLIEKQGRWFKFIKYKNDDEKVIRIERFQSIYDFDKNDKDLQIVREIINKFPKINKL